VIAVKICGLTSEAQARAALEAGADLLGFIFYPPSHRYLPPARAAEIVAHCRAHFAGPWRAVGVFVNLPLAEVQSICQQVGLDLVQLAGDEEADYCRQVGRPVIKVVRVDRRGRPSGPTDAAAWGAERVLLDTQRPGSWGGTGESYDWATVRPYAGAALLAGGLNPSNVGLALRQARPWGVDVSSGVERERVKDPALIRQFLQEVRQHDCVH
jgi:phosphoribosylanthranilate isomerase